VAEDPLLNRSTTSAYGAFLVTVVEGSIFELPFSAALF